MTRPPVSGYEADDPAVRVVRTIAGFLVLLVAWLHLLHPQYGLSRLLLFVDVGTIYDPRPPLFVLSGIALLCGVVLAFYGVRRRQLYLAGLGLMVAYLLGYVAWHTVLDHGAFWPHIHGHGHEVGIVENVLDHLREDTLALISKTAELALIPLLTVLAWVERG